MKHNIGDTVEIVKGASNNIKHYFSIGAIGIITNYRRNDDVYVVRGPYKDDIIDQELNEGSFINKSQSKTSTMSNSIAIPATMTQLQMIQQTADKLLKANNTVTTLEIKVQLRKDYPLFYWTQNVVSEAMNDLYNEGKYNFTDNGTYRIYSAATGTVKASPAVAVSMASAGTTSAPVNVSASISSPSGTSISTATPPSTLTVVAQAPAKAEKISRTKALDLMKNNKGHFFTAEFVSKKGDRTINCQYLKDQDQSQLGYVKVREAGKMKTDPNDCIRQINMQTLKALRIAGKSYIIK